MNKGALYYWEIALNNDGEKNRRQAKKKHNDVDEPLNILVLENSLEYYKNVIVYARIYKNVNSIFKYVSFIIWVLISIAYLRGK